MDIAAIRELLGNFKTFVENFNEFFTNFASGVAAAVDFSASIHSTI